MGQAVEQRSGHFRVAKDRRPFSEVEIGCHDDRGALVEAADEMEQQLATGLSEGKIPGSPGTDHAGRHRGPFLALHPQGS